MLPPKSHKKDEFSLIFFCVYQAFRQSFVFGFGNLDVFRCSHGDPHGFSPEQIDFRAISQRGFFLLTEGFHGGDQLCQPERLGRLHRKHRLPGRYGFHRLTVIGAQNRVNSRHRCGHTVISLHQGDILSDHLLRHERTGAVVSQKKIRFRYGIAGRQRGAGVYKALPTVTERRSSLPKYSSSKSSV